MVNSKKTGTSTREGAYPPGVKPCRKAPKLSLPPHSFYLGGGGGGAAINGWFPCTPRGLTPVGRPPRAPPPPPPPPLGGGGEGGSHNWLDPMHPAGKILPWLVAGER